MDADGAYEARRADSEFIGFDLVKSSERVTGIEPA